MQSSANVTVFTGTNFAEFDADRCKNICDKFVRFCRKCDFFRRMRGSSHCFRHRHFNMHISLNLRMQVLPEP